MLAVVTGATSGIGRSYARELARRHYDIVVTGRRADLLTREAAELATAGIHVRTIVGDLTDEEVFSKLKESVQNEPVTYLVNNAGTGFGSQFVSADENRIDSLIRLLAIVPGRTIHAALPGMLEAGGGTIVNVGSLAGRFAVPGSSVYCACKSYLERLTESLALELASSGVVVQALLPGYVKTDFHRAIEDYKNKQKSRGLIRWMDAEDVVSLSVQRAGLAMDRLKKGKLPRPRDTMVVPGRLNAISRFVPRRLLYRGASRRKRLK